MKQVLDSSHNDLVLNCPACRDVFISALHRKEQLFFLIEESVNTPLRQFVRREGCLSGQVLQSLFLFGGKGDRHKKKLAPPRLPSQAATEA
ncbi:hypothetical protein [Bryocella elongata]|uniref:hypothetical protein n=1 Tax=Bryocella elongata TaxID=863522 RepID=UPI0011B087DC|nr:hypothetical protein [Bryocella elongata]